MDTEAKQPIEWVPKQYKQPEIHDLRCAKQGPKGYKERQKRKLEEMEALHQQDLEEAASRMQDDTPQAMEEDSQPGSKRRKAEGKAYIPVSGRVWKAPASKASEVMKPKLSSTWEKKMSEKALRQQLTAQKKEAVDEARQKRKAAAQQRKEAAERKKVNRAKSEVVQKITNNSTLKKMMKHKKQKNLLRKADTN